MAGVSCPSGTGGDIRTDPSQRITVAVSIVFCLGITGLPAAAVSLVRSRASVQLDWILLVCAGCIFPWQLQYRWTVIEFSGLVRTWTILQFGILLVLVVLLDASPEAD